MFDLDNPKLNRLIQNAYQEDLGDAGDITTLSTIPADAVSEAYLAARAAGIACGMTVVEACFRFIDPDLSLTRHFEDGEQVRAGDCLMTVRGKSRSILVAERVALNLIGRMMGIAGLTREYVQAVEGTRAQICCTRKTTPGLRFLEKYAVRCGGGMNHRFGLYDAVLIKDNHIAASGGVGTAIDNARARVGHMVKIEVEIDRLSDLEEALGHKPDIIMLDNMAPDELKEGVAIIGGEALVEASGSVSLETVASIAAAGVDLISVGRLTHSVLNFDVGLDFSA